MSKEMYPLYFVVQRPDRTILTVVDNEGDLYLPNGLRNNDEKIEDAMRRIIVDEYGCDPNAILDKDFVPLEASIPPILYVTQTCFVSLERLPRFPWRGISDLPPSFQSIKMALVRAQGRGWL